MCYLSLTSACVNVGALNEVAVGVAANWKSKVISILIIKNAVNPPKSHTSTHTTTAHRGWYLSCNQSNNRANPGARAFSQSPGSPAPDIWAAGDLFRDPTTKRWLLVGLAARWNCRKQSVAPGEAETHCLHSISDSCNLIEHLITIFARLDVCPLQAAICLTQSPFPGPRPSSSPSLPYPLLCFHSTRRATTQTWQTAAWLLPDPEPPPPLFPILFWGGLRRISICVSQ